MIYSDTSQLAQSLPSSGKQGYKVGGLKQIGRFFGAKKTKYGFDQENKNIKFASHATKAIGIAAGAFFGAPLVAGAIAAPTSAAAVPVVAGTGTVLAGTGAAGSATAGTAAGAAAATTAATAVPTAATTATAAAAGTPWAAGGSMLGTNAVGTGLAPSITAGGTGLSAAPLAEGVGTVLAPTGTGSVLAQEGASATTLAKNAVSSASTFKQDHTYTTPDDLHTTDPDPTPEKKGFLKNIFGKKSTASEGSGDNISYKDHLKTVTKDLIGEQGTTVQKSIMEAILNKPKDMSSMDAIRGWYAEGGDDLVRKQSTKFAAKKLGAFLKEQTFSENSSDNLPSSTINRGSYQQRRVYAKRGAKIPSSAPSHKEGGVNLYYKGGEIAAEVEGGERVFSALGTSKMEDAARKGNYSALGKITAAEMEQQDRNPTVRGEDGVKVVKAPKTYQEAYDYAVEGGVKFPAAVAAQWALESGRGKRTSGTKYNYFGIKYNEEAAERMRKEGIKVTKGKLRKDKATGSEDHYMDFENPAAAFQAYQSFIDTNSRYDLAMQAEDASEYIKAIWEKKTIDGKEYGGYAEDKDYVTKIMSIIPDAIYQNKEAMAPNATYSAVEGRKARIETEAMEGLSDEDRAKVERLDKYNKDKNRYSHPSLQNLENVLRNIQEGKGSEGYEFYGKEIKPVEDQITKIDAKLSNSGLNEESKEKLIRERESQKRILLNRKKEWGEYVGNYSQDAFDYAKESLDDLLDKESILPEEYSKIISEVNSYKNGITAYNKSIGLETATTSLSSLTPEDSPMRSGTLKTHEGALLQDVKFENIDLGFGEEGVDPVFSDSTYITDEELLSSADIGTLAIEERTKEVETSYGEQTEGIDFSKYDKLNSEVEEETNGMVSLMTDEEISNLYKEKEVETEQSGLAGVFSKLGGWDKVAELTGMAAAYSSAKEPLPEQKKSESWNRHMDILKSRQNYGLSATAKSLFQRQAERTYSMAARQIGRYGTSAQAVIGGLSSAALAKYDKDLELALADENARERHLNEYGSYLARDEAMTQSMWTRNVYDEEARQRDLKAGLIGQAVKNMREDARYYDEYESARSPYKRLMNSKVEAYENSVLSSRLAQANALGEAANWTDEQRALAHKEIYGSSIAESVTSERESIEPTRSFGTRLIEGAKGMLAGKTDEEGFKTKTSRKKWDT